MSPEPEYGYPEHNTIANVMAWVEQDPEQTATRARVALDLEQAGDKRPQLIERLTPLAGSPTTPGAAPGAPGTAGAASTDRIDTGAPVDRSDVGPAATRARDEAPANQGAEAAVTRTPWDEAHASTASTAAADPDADAARIANRDRRPEHFVEAADAEAELDDLDAGDRALVETTAREGALHDPVQE